MNKVNKLLTLSGGRKFVVVEQCNYDGKDYYFVNEIINNDSSDVYKIFTIDVDENGNEKIKNIIDENIIKKITDIIEKKL